MRCPSCESIEPITEEVERNCPVCGEILIIEAADLLGDSPTRLLPEIRAPQLAMAELVERSIWGRKNAIAEAGVGTGKSLAYAIPAAASGLRTVISTATLGLQGQLVGKDLPFLQEAMAKLGQDFTFAVAKGKGNYVCPLAVKEATSDEQEPLMVTASFLDWVSKVESGEATGDKAELEADMHYKDWARVTAEDCIGNKCQFADTCGFRSARKKVASASLVVANHAVVGMDLAYTGEFVQNPILGPYDVLVVDEAHKALSYLRNAFSENATEKEMERAPSPLIRAGYDCYNGAAHNVLERTYKDFFTKLPRLQSSRDQFHIINKASLPPDLPKYIADVVSASKQFLTPIKGRASFYERQLEAGNRGIEWKEFFATKRTIRRVERTLAAIQTLNVNGGAPADNNQVAYLSSDRGSRKLTSSPIDIGPYLHGKLYPMTASVILTSATLSIGGKFDHVRKSFGIKVEDGYSMSVKSPFNYEKHAVLYIPKTLPLAPKGFEDAEPYAEKVAEEILSLAGITSGRMFVLFTSRAEMEAVIPRLYQSPWSIISQEVGTPTQSLLDRYRAEIAKGTGPILVGLKSLWEGVSIEGDDLSCVVIVKLPFPPMSDPIYKAMCDRAGDQSFMQVTVPEMVKDIQQGAGRLIRTASDIGIVAILDKRMHTKAYGSIVVNSLPFSQRSTNIDTVAKWYRFIKAQKEQK